MFGVLVILKLAFCTLREVQKSFSGESVTTTVVCSWFGTDNHTFTITSEYPALGVYPPAGSTPLPPRTYNSFSAAAIDTGMARYESHSAKDCPLQEVRLATGILMATLSMSSSMLQK